MNRVRLVTAALCGDPPMESDWPQLIETANRAWLCPAVYVALSSSGSIDRVPPAVREYLAFIHDRNLERNQRLRVQLLQSIRALNEAGIEPVLLKGCVRLFRSTTHDLGARMMSDIDISIASAELQRARAALSTIGYEVAANEREFCRREDVGVLELHSDPNRLSARHLSRDVKASSRREEACGAVAWIPSVTARATHLLVHDMIKDGDLWRFRMELRHLHELAQLATSAERIDWHGLKADLSDPIARRALKVQAYALQQLFRVPVPTDLVGGLYVGFMHGLRMITGGSDRGGSVIRMIGSLRWGFHRLRNGYDWRGAPRFMRDMRSLFAVPRPSKL